MWPLFVGIGCGFALALSFAWGVSTGVKLGKRAQKSEHEALRALGMRALESHQRELQAWLLVAEQGDHTRVSASGTGAEGSDDRLDRLPRAKEAAELAHLRTREALAALRPAWGDFEPGEPAK